MSNIYLTLMSCLFLTIACGKQDHSLDSECIATAVRHSNMVIYKGQDLKCKNYLSLYQFQNRHYFVLDNHCADVIPNPIDCEGNRLCFDMEDPICKEFFINSKWIRIIGVEK